MVHPNSIAELAVSGHLWESFEAWTIEQGHDTEKFSFLASHVGEVVKALSDGRH